MTEINVAFDAADQYELLMGRWSRAVGRRFLDWLAPQPGLDWLDVGCGTGAFTQLIAAECKPKSMTGADPAPAQIEYALAWFYIQQLQHTFTVLKYEVVFVVV